MSGVRFVVAGTSPLRAAWDHILSSILRIPSEQLSTAASDQSLLLSVTLPTGEQGAGVLPILNALRTTVQDEELRAFLGGDSAVSRSNVNQWSVLASRIALQPVGAADEADQQLLAVQEFLASTARATVADVLLYASLNPEIEARLPRLGKWASFASNDTYVAAIARAATSVASPVSGDGSAAAVSAKPTGSKAGAGAPAAKPNAEEIERRRLEKELAKAEKERLKQAAAATEGGAAATSAAAPAASSSGSKKAVTNADTVASTDIDIRVGRIESISRHPEADKLYVETMSFGASEPTRTIVSGLVDHYSAEELLGKLVLVVYNLKAKPLKGVTSNGMVLCASNADGLKIVSPPEGTEAGERVSFGGKLSAVAPPIPSNAATLELLAHFKTNDSGVVCWKDQDARVSKGPITSTLTNAVVK